MANSLQYRSALQALLPVVVENSPFIRSAYKEMKDSAVPSAKGKTVVLQRPNPHQFAAAAITSAAYGSGEQAVRPISETITLDQHYGVNFVPTDLEWAQMAWQGLVPMNVRLAVNALSKNIEGALIDKAILGAFQQITKTSDALYDLAAVGDKFNGNGLGGVRWTLAVPSILHWSSNANLLAGTIAGTGTGPKSYALETLLGRVEHSHSLSGKSYTDGTSDSLYQVAAGSTAAQLAVGSTSVLLDVEGTGTMKIGDIITFAGHTGNYVVTTTAVTAHSQTLNFYPGLRSAVTANEVIALTATTAASLGIAIAENIGVALAMRPEEMDPEINNLVFFETATDPNTGISLNYEVLREYKQTRKILSVLYGVGQCYGEGLVKYKIS